MVMPLVCLLCWGIQHACVEVENLLPQVEGSHGAARPKSICRYLIGSIIFLAGLHFADMAYNPMLSAKSLDAKGQGDANE